ncbi:hypothetical protein J4E82_005741 [Alternaria postmessia]|uniref:uncharacterized protein n=1 Tax=Alternaria postmessia TaxID=1187938 RepID=UPI0022241E0A|nr:uncharacterized protein J4E82_005741 [Alternaria postmessia]KAI5375548.1 hypothetical protein J4E82_005741 [Alternaria postmessia]
MHSGTKDRYVSNHEGMHQRKSGAPSRPSTFSSIPIRNAASSSKSYNGSRKPSRSSSSNNTPAELDTSLPKNFPKPLTCHFWHQNGRCSKRDVDCAYAHYDTGFISSASVTPLGASEAFAGRNIDKYAKKLDMPMPLLVDLQKRENIVAGGEAELEERQQTLGRQEDEVKDWESTVLRREIEVDEKERNVERTTASLVRKRRELKILEKSIKRREEALREKMT